MFRLPRTTWMVLFLACMGASWFACQCILVPQPARFAPNWEGARWIRANDAQAPVAYFRYTTSISAVPDAAFVMIAASQVFRLYINGTFIASNDADFSRDSTSRTYIYNVNPLLLAGSNVIALRIANVDQQQPSVRVNFGIVRGKFVSYNVSGPTWQATAQSTLVYPRYVTRAGKWMTAGFTSYVWPSAYVVRGMQSSPILMVNPLLYEQPIASHWMSAGSGHEAYFVRQFYFGSSKAWIRLVATGIANVFINGHLLITWNGQAPVLRQSVASYLSDTEVALPYKNGLALGVYDITAYLHSGINTIAVHVSNPGVSAAPVGLDNLQALLSMDILLDDMGGHTDWLLPDATWHVSSQSISGWQEGASVALHWSSSIQVAHPGVSSTFYLPQSLTLRNTQIFPFLLVCEIVLLSCSSIVGLSLVSAWLMLRCYSGSYRAMLIASSTAYIPALACEALLMVLAREPLLPQPFPYTHSWGWALIGIVIVCYILVWLHIRRQLGSVVPHSIVRSLLSFSLLKNLRGKMYYKLQKYKIYPYIPSRIITWLSRYWIVLLLMLIAFLLSCYDILYEPYWQDELSSYYAAYGVLKHGLPFFPSGFLYEKAELYSYMLALWMTICGNSAGRFISALEYIVSIPLFYYVSCCFFQRCVALLATAMLTFSPYALLWARQVRMYEQAQLFTILVIYLFYRALQEQKRPYIIYIAILLLIADYLSHEEIFIILPALIICLFIGSRDVHYRLPSVFYNKHWWYALVMGVSCIMVQLLLTRVTHPPILGTDSSQRPSIQLSTDNIPFYIDMLFSEPLHRNIPWIALNSLLSIIGCIWSRYDQNRSAKYCTIFLCVSSLTLILLFTMQAERYFYPLLPIYYLMGAYALIKIFGAIQPIQIFGIKEKSGGKNVKNAKRNSINQKLWILRCAKILICLCVLLGPMLPLSNYNLFVSRMAGLPYHRHYPDYDVAGQYMQRYWQKDDIVISVAPDFCIFYYIGHVNYFFSIDRALFLFERDGHIVDTSIGIQALLNQNDFNSVLSDHARIWIISDNAEYQAQVTKRFTFPPDFHIVFEGYGSAIYFRGDGM